jgi:hypothetical protein
MTHRDELLGLVLLHLSHEEDGHAIQILRLGPQHQVALRQHHVDPVIVIVRRRLHIGPACAKTLGKVRCEDE